MMRIPRCFDLMLASCVVLGWEELERRGEVSKGELTGRGARRGAGGRGRDVRDDGGAERSQRFPTRGDEDIWLEGGFLAQCREGYENDLALRHLYIYIEP
jgi:hypothetical protein